MVLEENEKGTESETTYCFIFIRLLSSVHNDAFSLPQACEEVATGVWLGAVLAFGPCGSQLSLKMPLSDLSQTTPCFSGVRYFEIRMEI